MKFSHGSWVGSTITARSRDVAPPPPARGTRQHGSPRVVTVPWRDRVPCKGQGKDGPSVWVEPHRYSTSEIRAALALCDVCPARAECLIDEFPVGIRGGKVWGIGSAGRAVETKPRTCVECGTVFYPLGKASTCSQRCQKRLSRDSKSVRRACAHCGDVFVALHGNERTCSRTCRTARERFLSRLKDERRNGKPALSYGNPQASWTSVQSEQGGK